VGPLKIKIPIKNMREKPTNMYTNYPFSVLIMYGSSYMFQHYIAIFRKFLVPSERCSVEEQSIEYCGWACCVYWRGAWRLWMGVLCLVTWCVAISDRHVPRHYTQHAHPQYSVNWSSIQHLSEGTGNAPWGWQCNAETCIPYIINKLNE
jgi:hypothetical protein